MLHNVEVEHSFTIFLVVDEVLAPYSLSDAKLRSAARYPLPQCLDGTRSQLIREMTEWMQGAGRHVEFQAAWLCGPMGVGKSAIAQTLGIVAEKHHQLGAALFLSESKGRHNLFQLFTSVAQQLAHRSIDELHREIVRLIGGCTRSDVGQSLPLLWILSSRPEPHIRHAVSRELDTRCWREEIPLDGSDIELFIRTYLRATREDYSYIFSDEEEWPDEDAIHKMVAAAAGLFIYASTLIKFIQDEAFGNPKEQLTQVLGFIDGSTADTSEENPLQALDTLYFQVISRVQQPVLSTTLRLLVHIALFPPLPAIELANLLNLSHDKFYAALLRMHAVVAIPSSDKAPVENLHFYHTSFSDFLQNSSRSGPFALNMIEVQTNFINACFRALNQTKFSFATVLPWKAEAKAKLDPLSLSHHVLSYAARHVWAACIKLGNDVPAKTLDVIASFNFSRLIFVKQMISAPQVWKFAEWLSKQTERHNRRPIVRWMALNSAIFTLKQEAWNEMNRKQSCFALGEGKKAATIYIDADNLSIVPCQ
ncbi:hypothetical protein AN958_10103 [Leucoagaricus sp. SymC.cos]|nr:hypothetical protein AN958_10103 [Leucoagaricus sp. SymC.cos]